MEHITKITVRFCETDALGHVSNISYFIYLEQARVELFKALGAFTKTADWHFIMASCGCQFKNQAYFDQNLVVKTSVSHIGNSSLKFTQRLEDEATGQVIAVGESAIVYFNFVTQKSETIPDALRAKLELYQAEKAEKIG